MLTRTRLGYGAGCFGTDVFWQSTSFFLLFYYTDVLGLDATHAGLVFAAAMIWDGFIDPLMGAIASRTRTSLGTYRPYLLWGAVPLAAAYALMFAQPFLHDAGQGLVYALIAQVVFRTAYTVVSIPYGALSASITSDTHERGRLATFKVLGGALAAMFVALVTQPFVAAFPSPESGWFALAVLLGACSITGLFITYRTAAERPDLLDVPQPPLRTQVAAVLRNRPFLVVLVAIMVSSAASIVSGKVTVYYFTYYLGRAELAGVALAIQVVAVLALTPVWSWFARRRSKRAAWLAGAVLAAVGQAAFFAYDGHSPWVVLALVAFIWVGAAAVPVTFWSMAPDTVEVGEWRTGARCEGMVFGIVSLGQKVALGVGIGLTGILLDVIGYHPHVVQSPDTLRGLHAMMTLPALTGTVGAAAAVWFYRLDDRQHARLLRAIARRTRLHAGAAG